MNPLAVGLSIAVLLFLGSLSGAALAERTMDPVPGNPRAMNFELLDTAGQPRRLSDYRDRLVLVYFWATWCAPCRVEMPAKERLYQEIGSENLEILAVHVGRGGAAMDQFLVEVPVSFPVLEDPNLNLGSWGVMALPTTVLVDTNGHRRFVAVGPREWDSPEMVAFLRDLLQETATYAEDIGLGTVDPES